LIAQADATTIASLVDQAIDLSSTTTPSSSSSSSPADSEIRAYESLIQLVDQTAILQNPPEVQVTRIQHNNNENESIAFLIQCPEPIDWKRISIEVSFATSQAWLWQLPQSIKLTDVTFGTSQPNEESVTLLLRDSADLRGDRIEYRILPRPLVYNIPDNEVLLRDYFAKNDTTGFTTIDEGVVNTPSSWATFEGTYRQISKIDGGTAPEYPGTYVIAGDAAWTDIAMKVTLKMLPTEGAIGVMFRYKDAKNYYRFSMDSQNKYRRLIKKVAGTVTILWEDSIVIETSRNYEMTIIAAGNILRGYMDGIPLFVIVDNDGDLPSGLIGLYCWDNTDARFSDLAVYNVDSL
jgi:hypothetical protein